MKIARILYEERIYYANIVGEEAFLLDNDITSIDGFDVTSTSIPLSECEMLAPVRPEHMYAVGLNYAAHVDEFKHIDPTRANPEAPITFLCAATALAAPDKPIHISRPDHRVHYEAELVVVIGKRCSNVTKEEALDYVLGYTCGNDVSDRDYQNADKQWLRAKSQRTYKPLGPWIETEIEDPQNLRIRSYLNGELRQDGNTCDMLFDVADLIVHLSAFTNLYPGDVIYTGTPVGVGEIHPGDEVVVEIEGIGQLRNPVEG